MSRKSCDTTTTRVDQLHCINMAWKSTLASLPWSVFGRVIHTNNDVEGWHHCLNQKAKKEQLPFYQLVHLLHETKWINIEVHLVLEHKTTHHEERWYRMVQSRVLSIWDDYTYGKISASQLLNACSKPAQVPK